MAPATVTTSPAPPRGRGRPRDASIDERVRIATVELLAAEGYAATTMTAIARRAGLRTPALYRRWPTRTALVEDVVFPGFPELVLTPTGDLRADVQRYVDAYCDLYANPAARAAMPGLIAEYQTDPDVHRRFGNRIAGTVVREAWRAIVHEDLDDPAMEPDDALDILIGSVMQHCFVRPFFGRAADNAYVTDAVVRALGG